MLKWTINGGIVFSLSFLLDLFRRHLSANPIVTASFMIYCPDLIQTIYSLSFQQKVSYPSQPRGTFPDSDICISFSPYDGCTRLSDSSCYNTKNRSSLGENISIDWHTHKHTHGLATEEEITDSAAACGKNEHCLLLYILISPRLKVKHGNAPVMLWILTMEVDILHSPY